MIGAARAASQRQLILLADEKIGTTAGSQSYTIPAGTQYIDIELYGGGGGGAAGREYSSGRQNYISGGGGGGGGAYVRYGYTGVFGGDLLNFEIGAAGTGATYQLGTVKNGISGGNTSLTSLVRGGSTVVSFSGIIAYGAFGGCNTTSTTVGGAAGTGGVAVGGNITNRNGNNGTTAGQGNNSLVVAVNGGKGGSGGQNDSNLSPGVDNGGAAGTDNGAGTSTNPGAGGNATSDLIGGGGGGGGAFPAQNNLNPGLITPSGAAGGFGGIRIRSYG